MYLPLIQYREYTTDGRFVTKSEYVTTREVMQDDIEALLDPTLTSMIEADYKRSGKILEEESLKDIWPTNVVVRDMKTGRFIKWKN